MINRYIDDINNVLDRTGKAVITLGDSFPFGYSAFNTEIYEKYNITRITDGLPFLKIENNDLQEIVNTYNIAYMGNDSFLTYDMNFNIGVDYLKYDFTDMFLQNAFSNVLTSEYLNGEYANINLSSPGLGNRAAISELFLLPEIHWNKIKKAIVIYMPSTSLRLDLINDNFLENNHFDTFVPIERPKFFKDVLGIQVDERMNKAYAYSVWSDRYSIIEQILNINILKTWCQSHNAELIITPGFTTNYTKEHFQEILSTNFKRDRATRGIRPDKISNAEAMKLIDEWPWESMFCPEGHETLLHLALARSGLTPAVTAVDGLDMAMIDPSNEWLAPCCHPKAKTHSLYAELLHKELIARNIL